ncbi:MAG: hypothetical protein FWC91_10000 [Defluviitaleaceae bacterium]|nr:hypothetical protein [Defluviitaleaceae bacterium]
MNTNRTNIFNEFLQYTITELEDFLNAAATRDEALFYQRLLALKMGLAQEKIVGKELL